MIIRRVPSLPIMVAMLDAVVATLSEQRQRVNESQLSSNATSILFKLSCKLTPEDFVLFLHRSCGYPATQRPYNFIHLPWKQLAVVNFISHEECNFCFRVMKCLAGVPGVPVADVREGLHLGLEANLAHFCAKCCQMSSYETLPLVFVNNQEVPLKLACQSFVSDDLLMHFLEQLPGHKTKKTPMQKIPKAGKQPNKQHHNKMVPPGLAPLGLTKQGPNTLDLGYAPPQLDGLHFNALGPGGSTVVFSL